MEIQKTGFDGLLIITPRVFADDRGYFYESYNQQTFASAGISYSFVQDNQSSSLRGVVRGLHYQLAPYAQTKLVRVIAGRIFDVVVDIRRHSPMFGKWFGIELSGENKVQLLVPQGFAHGFSVLSEQAVVLYKTDDLYKKEAERGIRYNDPALAIDWHLKGFEPAVSEKDAILPDFEHAEYNFTWSPS